MQLVVLHIKGDNLNVFRVTFGKATYSTLSERCDFHVLMFCQVVQEHWKIKKDFDLSMY